MPAPSLRFCVFAAVGLLLSAAPRVAAASPTYPGLIDTDLGITYLGATDCIICHENNNGGVGTVVQPFGMAMVAAGLTLENPPALQTALATLTANGTDSDCAGVPDIQQLTEGYDPNTGACLSGMCTQPLPNPPDAGGAGCVDTSLVPLYGCGAQLAPGAAGAAGAATSGLLALAMLASARARRRRR